MTMRVEFIDTLDGQRVALTLGWLEPVTYVYPAEGARQFALNILDLLGPKEEGGMTESLSGVTIPQEGGWTCANCGVLVPMGIDHSCTVAAYHFDPNDPLSISGEVATLRARVVSLERQLAQARNGYDALEAAP